MITYNETSAQCARNNNECISNLDSVTLRVDGDIFQSLSAVLPSKKGISKMWKLLILVEFFYS